MITPRHTRLLRASDLTAFRTALAERVGRLAPSEARETLLLVPTRAAAEQLRRTLEHRLLSASRPVIVLPILGTRADMYAELASRLVPAPRVLSAFEREVLVAAISREVAAQGTAPPFALRPGLVAEMLSLYDLVRRLGRTVEDFDRNFRGELERDCDTDRGAEKLLQQTVFLTAVFTRYEARLQSLDAVDEHGVRVLLTGSTPTSSEDRYRRALRHIVITVADRVSDPDGLWPADYDLLAQLPRLDSIELVATEATLGAGLLERLHAVLPDLAEERAGGAAAAAPLLVTPVTPPDGITQVACRYRDREEELAAVARRLKDERRRGAPDVAPLHRTALVVRRPLPYLYVARDVFAGAGIPFEALDTLPLAAEPYAAAMDLVIEAVSTDFSRASVVSLLRSPHFRFVDQGELPRKAVAALDAALAEARYLGGLDRLTALAGEWLSIETPSSREERKRHVAAPAAATAAEVVRPLASLAAERPIAEQIQTLLDWLRVHEMPPDAATDVSSRRLRVRAAILGALTALAEAYRLHDPTASGDITVVAAGIRRWLGSQTFAASTGAPGLQIVDAQAARFGEFDDVQLVGLIDGEWPERFRRNVLYPSSLLAQLEPLPIVPDPGRRERDALNAARAGFRDLLHLSLRTVRLSTFLLENDSVVEPSILLDEVDALHLPSVMAVASHSRVFQFEALASEPRRTDVLDDGARRWAEARIAPVPDRGKFQGHVGTWTLPRVSVSRLERYLDCPFRFFASEVLRLEEQPEDEDTRTPLERGRFLHELFERFFREWQQRGHRRIDSRLLPEARQLFTNICEEALATLSPSEATLERTRLLGSAVSPGIAHRVFAMEAERATDVLERLLEFPLQGDFVFRTHEGGERTVPLSAKTDRIDLLADGTMRVIDYKSKTTPDLKTALQLPIYSHCAHVRLHGRGGRTWVLSEAMYLSFEGEKAVVPLRAKGRTVDELIADAQDRLLATLDDIAGGRFPIRPSKKSLCGLCPYASVCRLDYVAAEAAEDDGR